MQFIVEPSGRSISVSTGVQAGTAFENFLLPGLFLFVVLGLFPVSVCYGRSRGDVWAWTGSIALAAVFFAWVIAEGFVLGFGDRLQTGNLGQGVLMALLGGSPSVRERYR